MTVPFPNPAPLVTASQLAAELGDPALRIFDCTTYLHPLPDQSGLRVESGRAGYEEGHIPGTAFLDLAVDLSDQDSPHRFAVPGADAFAKAAGKLGISNASRVVVYDRTYGAWGARVWWMLRGYGFDDVRVLDGGLTTWRQSGLPLETTANTYPAATFEAKPRAGFFVTKDEVKAAISARDAGIVNALLPEQHRGDGGVNYGRPGRIPGSCNVPSRGIVDADTQAFIPPETLRQRFDEAGLLDGRRVIAYCGGGIAASLTALALTVLGARDVGVYMNSMQEWAKDADCPMEQG